MVHYQNYILFIKKSIVVTNNKQETAKRVFYSLVFLPLLVGQAEGQFYISLAVLTSCVIKLIRSILSLKVAF